MTLLHGVDRGLEVRLRHVEGNDAAGRDDEADAARLGDGSGNMTLMKSRSKRR